MRADDQMHRSVWLYLLDTAFTHGFIDAGGVRTRYLEAGQRGKPIVLMLHGTGGSLDTFCANIGAFADHFHVFCIDMLGSGFTGKPESYAGDWVTRSIRRRCEPAFR